MRNSFKTANRQNRILFKNYLATRKESEISYLWYEQALVKLKCLLMQIGGRISNIRWTYSTVYYCIEVEPIIIVNNNYSATKKSILRIQTELSVYICLVKSIMESRNYILELNSSNFGSFFTFHSNSNFK